MKESNSMKYVCQSALDLDDQYHKAIFETLSSNRMAAYIAAVPKGDKAQALVLYGYNQSLSALFFELLGNIEVTLRNRIHQQLTTLYGKPDWFDDIKAVLSKKRAQDIEEAMESIQRSGEDPSSGLIISKLSFGFWVALFEAKYLDRFWTPSLRHIFPPTHVRKLHDDLVAIRDLRNSIAHHERILKYDLRAELTKAEKVLGMICPAMLAWSSTRLCQPIRDCLSEMEAFVESHQNNAAQSA